MITHIFKDNFGYAPKHDLFTPGRVNLIGEHTDYNGGMVLPTAIQLGPHIALSPRTDNEIHIYSDKFETIAHRTLQDNCQDTWSDYITGAVIYANQTGLLSGGADIAVQTSLPFGAGLSSSAAIIVGILKIGRDISHSTISDTDIAVLARRVENDFIGMPCGIMDQMAVAIARPGQALALDTESLKFDLVDLPIDYHMAVIHSGQFRALSEGRYKTRKEECDIIKTQLGRTDICKISDAEFKSLRNLPRHIQRRAKHCMTEHRRTVSAIEALQNHDIDAFGRYMIESHISMRDDFENTLPQLDRLVDDAVALGAKGARMTGGGFGGCIVACIETSQQDRWVDELLARHSDAFYVA